MARSASSSRSAAAARTTPKRKRLPVSTPTTDSISVGSVVSVQNKAYEGYIYRVSGYGVEAVGKRMAMLEFVSFDNGSVAEAGAEAEAEAGAAVVDDDAEVPERLLRLVSAGAQS